MKIKTITLYNIGPYIDKNTFDITIKDKKKNIILIGGKNGAGKTTFFKSIKTCLYGCKVWGYEAPGKDYYNIISNLVNMKMQYDNTVKAYIEIELIFDDGKQVNSYNLHREWIKNKKKIEEYFIIRKDGILLSESEQADFSNYLLSIIPPDMFNFYFFDGEAISDFFLGNNGGKNFKNAFLKLYGLDTLSLMVENFERYFRKKDVKNNTLEEYQNSKKTVENIENRLKDLKEEKEAIENEIDLKHIKIHALQKEYTQGGGVSLAEWKEINAELTKEEARRDEINRWLKEVANHYLPFIIVKKELDALLQELNDEREYKKMRVVIETLNNKSFISQFSEYLDSKNMDKSLAGDLISYICKESFFGETKEILFDLSEAQTDKLISQVYEKIEFDEKSILKAIKELNSSLVKNKKLREKMTSSSVDGYDEFYSEKEQLEKDISTLTILLEKKNQEIELMEADLIKANSNYSKAKENYEKQLKNKSINELSMRAIGTYSLLEEQLIRRQGLLLQQEFIKCFSSIINKANFLDGIVIDKNINVIPYKFVDVTFVQIENYLKMNEQTHFLELFDNKYLLEINKLRLGDVDSIKLPSPINAPFSQGERQVYIMSIYLALLKTSRKDIPFFIDTPFARIDSNHREKIVGEFFKSISNQLFILSTDEEIVGEYEQLIDEQVSNKFELSISDYGKTSIIPEKYFEV